MTFFIGWSCKLGNTIFSHCFVRSGGIKGNKNNKSKITRIQHLQYILKVLLHKDTILL